MKINHTLLPDGTHKWDFRLGGSGGKRPRVRDTNFEAGERKVRKIIYEFENGLAPGNLKRGLSFVDICSGYLGDNTQGLPPTHQRVKTITSQIACFKRDIPNYHLSDFGNPKHEAYNAVDRWMKAYLKSANRLGGPIAPQSVNRKFNTLRAIFNWAISRGLLHDNPCKRVKKLGHDQTLPRFLSEAEIKALFETARRVQFINYCTIALHTGMRPGEILELKVENVDLPNNLIMGFQQKRRKRLGSVPIKKWLVAPLIRMIGDRTSGSLLNYTLGQLREDAEYGIKKAGINAHIKPGTSKFTIYGLRHTFASHSLMEGKPMSEVATWLRHTSQDMCFKHYGHLTQQHLLASGNTINLVPTVTLKVVGGHNVDTSQTDH